MMSELPSFSKYLRFQNANIKQKDIKINPFRQAWGLRTTTQGPALRKSKDTTVFLSKRQVVQKAFE